MSMLISMYNVADQIYLYYSDPTETFSVVPLNFLSFVNPCWTITRRAEVKVGIRESWR